jgi:hypothetical protein
MEMLMKHRILTAEDILGVNGEGMGLERWPGLRHLRNLYSKLRNSES